MAPDTLRKVREGRETDADVRSLAAKLKGLHALLPPEQALSHAALRRAAGSGRTDAADTGGFAWAVSFNPFAYLDAIRAEGAAGNDG